jgi:hypothetical protein
MTKLRNPNPPPKEVQFKQTWKTGKANKRISFPSAIAFTVIDIAKCLDRDPAIADKVLQYAQSLVEQSEQNSPDCL